MSKAVGSQNGMKASGRSPAEIAALVARIDARMAAALPGSGLTLAEMDAGVLTAQQLAQVCRVLPMLIEGWTTSGWLPSEERDEDGTVLYRTTCIPMVEAMLEMAEYIHSDDALLRRNLLHLRDQMKKLWVSATLAEYAGDAVPVPEHRVTLMVDGREVELTFLQRALARLQDLSPA